MKEILSDSAFEPLLISELLGGVPEPMLRAISPAPTLVELDAGETLIRQGEEGTDYYLLVQGRLRVFRSDEKGGSRVINEVCPGEGVGEMSLLTGDVTSASVRAMHDSVVVRFPRESYLWLMENSPQAALQVMKTVIRRLRGELAGGGRARHPVHPVVTLLPLSPAGAWKELAFALAGQLAKISRIRLLTRDDVPERWRKAVADRSRLALPEERALSAWLGEQNRGLDQILLLADFESSEWTRLCLRQADLVMLLGKRGEPTAQSEAESGFLRRIDKTVVPRMDLVLLGQGGDLQTSGTAEWFKERTVTEWHHLREGAVSDLSRLARVLCGQAVNLVLGGGGARGLAQIGALRAFQEAGIPVDRVCGTSMGSMIGAMCASRMDPAEMIEIHRDLWMRQKPLRDYTFPSLSVLRGRKLEAGVRRIFGTRLIEDLPIAFFCCSGNLADAELVIHDRGLLWQAIRASGSLPGAGPPLFLDGRILVDGGVLNNLPGDLMFSRHSGRLVLVDVSRERSVRVPENLESTPSGWSILLNRLLPFRKPVPVPGIFEVLYRAATLGSIRRSRSTHQLADLILTPPVQDYSILSVQAMDQIIELGYRDTVKRLEQTGFSVPAGR